VAALLCVAGGVLTKWTAPAFFYGTVVPLLWWRGRLRLLFGRYHLVSAALAAGVCCAWAGAATSLAGWHALYDTVSREALMRLSPSHHPRPYPWREVLGHPFRVLAANLPWSVAALFTLRPGFARRWDERGRFLLEALHCWVWPNLVFWSVIPEHAIRHSFPLFPGIAGLAALVVADWLRAREAGRQAFSRTVGYGLVGILGFWLVAKVAFVHFVMPVRLHSREPRTKAERIANVVPPEQVLYLFRLKDEGIMFYYGRPVLRLPGPHRLPSSVEPLYCILDESEWRNWRSPRDIEALLHLQDEQGDPIVLAKVAGSPGNDER
jgi:hypothetical protein